jgi:hypothetical protein
MAVPVVAVRAPLEPTLILPAIIAMAMAIITAVITVIILVVIVTTIATTAATTARATCYHLQLLIIQLYEKCYVLHFFLPHVHGYKLFLTMDVAVSIHRRREQSPPGDR